MAADPLTLVCVVCDLVMSALLVNSVSFVAWTYSSMWFSLACSVCGLNLSLIGLLRGEGEGMDGSFDYLQVFRGEASSLKWLWILRVFHIKGILCSSQIVCKSFMFIGMLWMIGLKWSPRCPLNKYLTLLMVTFRLHKLEQLVPCSYCILFNSLTRLLQQGIWPKWEGSRVNFWMATCDMS